MAALNPPGNQVSTSFFNNALMNRTALVPAAGMLASFANKSLGAGSASAYNSWVKTTQQNGAGPAMAPIRAPWSFTQFATGKRVLTSAIKKRIGK